jgi:hypothetical protein
MLEKQLREANHKRCKDLFLEVHRPLRNDYVSFEELVRENSPQQARSLSTSFLLSTKAIFFTKRQDHIPHKLPAAHHNLGN